MATTTYPARISLARRDLGGRTERLYREHRADLVRFARLLCGSGEVAEEAVQDVFLSLHHRQNEVAPDRELAYLRRAVVLSIRGRWRRREVARRHLHALRGDRVDGDNPEGAALEADRRRAVDDALQSLPPRQRECIVLRYFADMTEPMIAETVGISVGSVKTHLHRARAVLSTTLEDQR